MKRVFIFIGCITFLFSCGGEDRPADILTQEEMVNSLIELYVVEAKVSNIPVNRDSVLKIFDYLEARTFDKLGISDSVFKTSYSYYLDRPKEMEAIYTIVIDSLSLREQQEKVGSPDSRQ
jgi:hypothetical protein